MLRVVQKIRHKLRWLYAEIKYLVTREKYQIVLAPQAKKELEMIKQSDPEGYEEIMRALDRLSRNPYIGEPVEDEE